MKSSHMWVQWRLTDENHFRIRLAVSPHDVEAQRLSATEINVLTYTTELGNPDLRKLMPQVNESPFDQW